MSDPRPTREYLIELVKRDPEEIVDLVCSLWNRAEMLQQKVAELLQKIAELQRNSRTSSKPPSTDKGNFANPPKPKPKSLRKKSGKKSGGQPGHPGSTLQQSVTPDHIEEHRLGNSAVCPECGGPLDISPTGKALDPHDCECRQVFELPPIRIEITEHRAEKTICHRCGTAVTATFPEGVAAPVQYGPTVCAVALYLGAYQMIPYQRLAETFDELFGCPLSEGTLGNIVISGGRAAAVAMEPVREALRHSAIAHADETSCNVMGKRHWLHVFSNSVLTCFHLDAKRGAEAMARGGMIPGYCGKLIHDCLAAYSLFQACLHYYCNGHLQRELTYVYEEMKQGWAKDMIELLLEAKKLADREKSRPPDSRHIIGEGTVNRIMARYVKIVLAGLDINPEPPPLPPGKRGRVKRSKPLNLLRRLDTRPREIMGFFAEPDAGIPYDNNQAERDLRMDKVREKISGMFRSEEHGQAFCEVRGVISCVRKQGRNMLESLKELIVSPLKLGESLAAAKGT